MIIPTITWVKRGAARQWLYRHPERSDLTIGFDKERGVHFLCSSDTPMIYRKKGDLTKIDHPSIVSQPSLGFGPNSKPGSGKTVVVTIKCPRCLNERNRAASEIRKEMIRPNFKGYCRQCSWDAMADGTHRIIGRKPRSLKNSHAGYVFKAVGTVPDDLLPMYRAMQRHQQPVYEHRWTMACHLGRALTSRELVDHRDGDKTNNDINNLRIYIKGKNHEGSAHGYGTYYHEWQTALAKIARLEAEIASHSRLKS